MSYNDEIRSLLDLYHDRIENEIIPQLTKEFTAFYGGLTELNVKLKTKGLLKEDPYFKGSEVIELELPDNSSFAESDAQWKTAERITHYESILSYITHNYNFSLSSFNFVELEKIKKFLDYYDWKGILNPATSDTNTRYYGKICIEYRQSTSDSLVISTFDKCIDVISNSVGNIFNKLKFILLYLKESYKLFIRADILPIVLEKNPGAGESKLLALISKEIKDNYSYLKLYKKYIEEVIKEEYTDAGKELKETVIKRLTVTKKQEVKKENEYDPKKALVLLFLEIGKSRNQIATSMEKLYYNHNNLIKNKGSFLSKLIKNITRMLFNTTPKTLYEVKIQSKTGGSKSMVIHFEKYYQEIKKLEFDLLSFAEEDKSIIFVNKYFDNIKPQVDKLLMNIKKQITILQALDNKLKVELKYKNVKAKGIKPEITVIKTIINSATAMYRDYLDQIGE